jgi:predicted ABC-type transport system involved in lysophospholipase L1 biosynthesis ATPase subunit
MPEALVMAGVTLASAEGERVFSDLDWTLPAGGRVVLKAGSGSGTTAFLRLCAGLATPDAGRVVLDGVPLSATSFQHPFVGRGDLGWVPTDGGLLVNMSLQANVALPLRFTRGMGKEAAFTRAQEALDALGLGPLASRRPHAVEPRERWLATLARTAAVGCALWLVDRPTGHLGREMLKVTAACLNRAAADPARTLILVDGPWLPPLEARSWSIEDGRMIPEDTP